MGIIANIAILLILMLFLCGFSETACDYQGVDFDIPAAYQGTYTAEYSNAAYNADEVAGTVEVSVERSSTALNFVNLSAYFTQVDTLQNYSAAIKLKFNGKEKELTIQQNEDDAQKDSSQRRYLFEACMTDVLKKYPVCVDCFFVIENGTRYLYVQMDPGELDEIPVEGWVRLKKTS